MRATRSIVWQDRQANRGPVAIRDGLEKPWPGSTIALLKSAKSVTLLTRAGSEVIVGDLQHQADGGWSGIILKFASGADHLTLGATVHFHEDNVLGATV